MWRGIVADSGLDAADDDDIRELELEADLLLFELFDRLFCPSCPSPFVVACLELSTKDNVLRDFPVG